jgi:anti-sigma factor RsiW
MTQHPKNLIAWLDNEVGEQDASQIKEHVETCAVCQAEVSMFREASGFVDQVLKSAARDAQRRFSWRGAAAFALPVAAALALMLVPIRPAAKIQPPIASNQQQPVIRISIPADAVLPPGAAPAGFEIVADVDINVLP